MRKIAHAGSTARTMVNICMEAANSPEQIYDELAALQSVFFTQTRSVPVSNAFLWNVSSASWETYGLTKEIVSL
ncbi:hypothetical protein TNCV_461671 [Trichonephila clavipes]|nr:hypothetical protein TNCV_461671 [Trichonephila clavipes]